MTEILNVKVLPCAFAILLKRITIHNLTTRKQRKRLLTLNKLNMPRQLYEKTYIPNGLIDIISSKSFLKNKSTHGKRVIPFIVNQLYVDIDNKLDFEYANFLINKGKM